MTLARLPLPSARPRRATHRWLTRAVWLIAGVLLATATAAAVPAAADPVTPGASAVVANTAGAGLRLRQGPGADQPVLIVLPDGTPVRVVEGPVADRLGGSWCRVAFGAVTGWASTEFLVHATAPASGLAQPSTSVGQPPAPAPAGLATGVAPAPGNTAPAPPPMVTALTAPNPAPSPVPNPAPAVGSAATTPGLTANGPVAAATTQGSNTTAPGGATATGSGAASRNPSARPAGASVVSFALSFLGAPYVWGGQSPAGFDCSGFVYYVYGQLGVALPRTAEDQWLVGREVKRDDLATGDLVFFANTYRPGITHVGIYAGDGTFVQAETEATGVVRSPLNAGYWATKYHSARRVLD